MNYPKKPKPQPSGQQCPVCGKPLKDFELLHGCSSCKLNIKKTMSKVEAYRCDVCGEIRDSEQMYGVETRLDLFSDKEEFRTVIDPSKADIHYCGTCYETKVSRPAYMETNRRKDEPGYQLKLKELSTILKQIAVRNFRTKKIKF